MIPKTNNLKMTTPGPFIVTTNVIKGSPDRRSMICVACANNPAKIVAFTGVEGAPDENESIANAALFAVAKDMLNALIIIQNKVLDPGEESDLVEINAMISDIFAKLANEAGEEL